MFCISALQENPEVGDVIRGRVAQVFDFSWAAENRWVPSFAFLRACPELAEGAGTTDDCSSAAMPPEPQLGMTRNMVQAGSLPALANNAGTHRPTAVLRHARSKHRAPAHKGQSYE